VPSPGGGLGHNENRGLDACPGAVPCRCQSYRVACGSGSHRVGRAGRWLEAASQRLVEASTVLVPTAVIRKQNLAASLTLGASHFLARSGRLPACQPSLPPLLRAPSPPLPPRAGPPDLRPNHRPCRSPGWARWGSSLVPGIVRAPSPRGWGRRRPFAPGLPVHRLFIRQGLSARPPGELLSNGKMPRIGWYGASTNRRPVSRGVGLGL
jgi:hypothetical protein